MNRYENIKNDKTESGKSFKKNVLYPNIPVSENDFYVIATVGDRYDTLAQQFYRDSTLWWIIASANNHQRASLVPTPGAQLRVPSNKAQAIQLYNSLNEE